MFRLLAAAGRESGSGGPCSFAGVPGACLVWPGSCRRARGALWPSVDAGLARTCSRALPRRARRGCEAFPRIALKRHFLASGFILKHLQGRHMFSAFGPAPSFEPGALRF